MTFFTGNEADLFPNLLSLFFSSPHRMINCIIQNLSLSAEERYWNFQQKYPNPEQRIPQKLIAEYLCITPEFFSMVRKKSR
jgi:hypothetical protein